MTFYDTTRERAPLSANKGVNRQVYDLRLLLYPKTSLYPNLIRCQYWEQLVSFQHFFLIIPAAIYPSSVQEMSTEIVNFARDKTKVRSLQKLSVVFLQKAKRKMYSVINKQKMRK